MYIPFSSIPSTPASASHLHQVEELYHSQPQAPSSRPLAQPSCGPSSSWLAPASEVHRRIPCPNASHCRPMAQPCCFSASQVNLFEKVRLARSLPCPLHQLPPWGMAGCIVDDHSGRRGTCCRAVKRSQLGFNAADCRTLTHSHIRVREAHVVLLVVFTQDILDEQILKEPFMIASVPA
jgi:hypothetical protein